MQQTTAKQDAIEAIARLPDDVSMDEIVYRLHVLSKIQQGLEDAAAGRSVPTEQLLKEIEGW